MPTKFRWRISAIIRTEAVTNSALAETRNVQSTIGIRHSESGGVRVNVAVGMGCGATVVGILGAAVSNMANAGTAGLEAGIAIGMAVGAAIGVLIGLAGEED